MSQARAVPAAPLRGRREHRKHLTRRELLAAGRRLFAERGLYESRIEDLSRLAGVAKGTLYLYFKNKEELVEAVATNGFNELLGQVHRAAQDARSREDAIALVAEAHLVFFDENPDLMRIFHQIRGLLKFKKVESRALRGVLSKYLAGLAHVLALHPPARPMREMTGMDSAMVLFGAVSGITSIRAALDGVVPSSGGSRATVRALAGLLQSYELAPRSRRTAGAGEKREVTRRKASVRKAAPGRRPRPRAARE